MKTVYISCPVAVDPHKLIYCAKSANNEVDDERIIQYWDRKSNSYEDYYVRDCDIFVIMLPDNAFNLSLNSLPNGCKKELKRAITLDKKIILAYKTNYHPEYSFYDVKIDSLSISGIQGTSGAIARYIHNKKVPQKELVPHLDNNIELPEETILLMLL